MCRLDFLGVCAEDPPQLGWNTVSRMTADKLRTWPW